MATSFGSSVVEQFTTVTEQLEQGAQHLNQLHATARSQRTLLFQIRERQSTLKEDEERAKTETAKLEARLEFIERKRSRIRDDLQSTMDNIEMMLKGIESEKSKLAEKKKEVVKRLDDINCAAERELNKYDARFKNRAADDEPEEGRHMEEILRSEIEDLLASNANLQDRIDALKKQKATMEDCSTEGHEKEEDEVTPDWFIELIEDQIPGLALDLEELCLAIEGIQCSKCLTVPETLDGKDLPTNMQEIASQLTQLALEGHKLKSTAKAAKAIADLQQQGSDEDDEDERERLEATHTIVENVDDDDGEKFDYRPGSLEMSTGDTADDSFRMDMHEGGEPTGEQRDIRF